MDRFLAKTLAKLNQLAAVIIISGGVLVFGSRVEEDGIALTLFYITITIGAAGLICGFVALLTLIEQNQRAHMEMTERYMDRTLVVRDTTQPNAD